MSEVINAADLHTYLECDFGTGKLFWKVRPLEMFEQEFVGKRWNDRYAGKEAFTSSDGHGYLVGNIKRIRYQAHRVVFAIANGRWPSGLIDHIDLDKKNNRPENLREATRQQNTWNKGLTVSAIAMANNNRRYKRRVTVERITCPPDHPNLRDVRGELRCYRSRR